MKFYNNIYAACYKFYSKFKNETPYSTSIIVVDVCQMTLILLIIVIIKKITNYNLASLLPNKYYFLPFLILQLYLLYKYYSKEKVNSILEEFETKSPNAKKMWGALTIFFFIAPLVLIGFLLKK